MLDDEVVPRIQEERRFAESDQCAADGNVNQCFGSADFAGKSDCRIAESDEFSADSGYPLSVLSIESKRT